MPHEYHSLPPTQKQVLYARELALRTNTPLPADVRQERYRLSRWIDAQKSQMGRIGDRLAPSAKQLAFAERIARARRLDIPDDCYRSRRELSLWIDRNRLS